jgi:hypothetical protein
MGRAALSLVGVTASKNPVAGDESDQKSHKWLGDESDWFFY